jgi:two-component system chemotaxis response regulator CheY
VPISESPADTKSTMNILVVDDDDGCCQLLRDLLAKEPDCAAVFTANGAEGWWVVSDPERHFDLGIFDIKMPMVDGLSLLKRIRDTPKLKDLPVILCTGVTERKIVQEAAQFVVQHYVVKPYSGTAMLEKIRSVGQAVLQPRPSGINLVVTSEGPTIARSKRDDSIAPAPEPAGKNPLVQAAPEQ